MEAPRPSPTDRTPDPGAADAPSDPRPDAELVADDRPGQPPDPGRRRRLMTVLAGAAATVLVADQVCKILVVANLIPNQPHPVIDGWLQLRLVRNPGAAFSLSTGTTWLFTLIAIAVVVVIMRTARRLGSLGWSLALGLLLGGALGNLTDRLLRAPGVGRGHVVDFIEYLKFPFMPFPVFNVADSCIVSAAMLIALLGVRDIPLEGRRPAGAASSQPDSSDPAPSDLDRDPDA